MAKRKNKRITTPSIALTLTSKMVTQAASAAGKGLFQRQIAALLGVPLGTYKSWLERGRQEIDEITAGKRDTKKVSLKVKLVLAVEHADAVLASNLHESIFKADDPEKVRANTLALALMSKRHPHEYSDKTETNITVQTESAKESLLSKLNLLKGEQDES